MAESEQYVEKKPLTNMKISNIYTVGIWNINASKDKCALTQSKITSDDSNNVIIGKCGCPFFVDAFREYIKNKKNSELLCPVCKIPWESKVFKNTLKKKGTDNINQNNCDEIIDKIDDKEVDEVYNNLLNLKPDDIYNQKNKKIYMPLKFWFSNNVGLYNNQYLNIESESEEESDESEESEEESYEEESDDELEEDIEEVIEHDNGFIDDYVSSEEEDSDESDIIY